MFARWWRSRQALRAHSAGWPVQLLQASTARRVHSQSMSAGNVTWWNPSQGSSGSDWAALTTYLPGLAGASETGRPMPRRSRLIPPSPPQTPVEQPGSCYTYARKCWPECPRDDIKWNQPVAARTRALQREYCQLCGGRQRYRGTAVHQPHTAAGGSAPSNGRRPRDDCRGGAAPPALACCSKAVLAGRSAAVAASSLLPRGD
jgi:hypothetical protein